MIGLFYRDFYLNRKNILLAMILFTFMSWNLLDEVTGNEVIDTLNILSFAFIFMFAALVESLGAEKNKEKWKYFLFSSPLDTKVIVGHKYILGVGSIIIGLLFSLLIISVTNYQNGLTFIFSELLGIIYAITIILVNSAVNNVIGNIFDEKKAMIFTSIFMILSIVIIFIFMAISQIGDIEDIKILNNIYDFSTGYPVLLLVLFASILYFVSYRISIKIFRKYIE